MAELKKDEEEVAEIESCDQEFLNELKTSLAEQRYESALLRSTWRMTPCSSSAELDVFRADVSESMAKFERLNMRSAELDKEQMDAQNAIAECERILQIQNNSTKEEVFRLKGASSWSLSHPTRLN